ncbi:hypothetical protein A6R68_08026, partial [Neotoma lepida]
PEGDNATTAAINDPDVLNSQQYGLSPDYWSLGCLICEMIKGQPPVQGCKKKASWKEMNGSQVLETRGVYSP